MKAADIKSNECDELTFEYIKMVPDGELLELLEESMNNVKFFFEAIAENLQDYAYAPGKWTIKQVLQHMIDVERIFAYRILRFGRGDNTEIPGFEVDPYGLAAEVQLRSLQDLLEEYQLLRKATRILVKNLSGDNQKNSGVASGHPITVRAMAFKLIGHDLHHCYMIESRYLS